MALSDLFPPFKISIDRIGVLLAQDGSVQPPGPPPPTCVITSPTAAANVTIRTPITITGTTTLGSTVNVYLGATLLGAATVIGTGWSYSWTSANADAGQRTINAIATASSGGATTSAAGVQVLVSVSGGLALRNVSNRARSNSGFAASTSTWSSVSYHTVFCGAGLTLTSLDIGWDNWYANGTEQGSGGSTTIKAWVEYPLGATRQPLLWSGSAVGTVADGATLHCDTTTLNTPIPDGAKIGIWVEIVPSVGLVFSDTHQKSTAWGDSMNVGATGMTASSAKPSDSNGAYFGPSSIRGMTACASIFAAGDSRLVGVMDSATASDGLNGEVGRAFGPQYACITAACSGEVGASAIATYTKRLALAQSANYLIYEYGINDCVGNAGSVVDATATTAKGLAWPAGMRKTRLTLAPASTSTNNFTAADGSDQTTRTYDPARRAYNVLVNANASGWDATYDVAAVNELAPLPTGKWKGDGTANKYVVDGVHESTFGNQQYATAFPALL